MASTTLPDQTTGTARPKLTYVERFSLWQRLEHIVLLVSFTTLGVTGLPQKFATADISQSIITLFGGIEAIRVIHRGAAIILMALSIYHVVAVLYRVFVRRVQLSMLPVIDDFKHLIDDVLFYFGRRTHKAYYGRYNYAEKAEYLAVVWGTLVMIITGFMMWNPIATTALLPGEVIPAAKVAHGGEAVLAVLAIILWHFYHVHLRHFNKAMFTGKLSREEMQHEHPAELAQIEAGRARAPQSAATLRKRTNIFVPIAIVIVVLLGAGLVRFVTFEDTAIETVPPGELAEAFVPFTPTPTPTPTQTPTPTLTPTPSPTPKPGETVAPVAGDAWANTIGPLLTAQCGSCHVDSDMGGISFANYADALAGGAIVPGDPDASPLIVVQRGGDHMGQLTPAQIDQVAAWIAAGAPERPVAAGGSEGWTGGIDQLVAKQCSACHVESKLGGVSLASYADALASGAITPGDPAASVLVQVQEAGDHNGQFTPEELARVKAWIAAGAPETATGGITSPTAGFTWQDFELLAVDRCGSCHINTDLGDLSLKTYADALKGGEGGPAIVPGDAAASLLITVQQDGKHAGQFSDDELAKIIEWITAGAPEKAGSAVPSGATPTPAPQPLGTPTPAPSPTPTVEFVPTLAGGEE